MPRPCVREIHLLTLRHLLGLSLGMGVLGCPSALLGSSIPVFSHSLTEAGGHIPAPRQPVGTHSPHRVPLGCLALEAGGGRLVFLGPTELKQSERQF